MKKICTAILMICLLSVLLSVCVVADSEDISAFTANIDQYWQEHGIDAALDELMYSEKYLAAARAEMIAMYGENREIHGEYDKDLAAKTVSGIYAGKVDADNVVSWKGIP